jgi:hypothetical protein
MAPLGIHLTLLVGPTVAVPAPPLITEALESVEVTHDDSGRSGFQISLQATRSGPLGLADYPLLRHPLLRPFNRVILIVTVNALPRVLMDGFITRQDLVPGAQTGAAALTLTGEDVSLMMDLEERTAEHPAQPEVAIAAKIILSYARYGLVPQVVPPPALEPPLPIERTPVQRGTDRAYLEEMAQRYGHVFFVEPGPLPFANRAYWGPPPRLGLPQRALSVNMGPLSNVDSISFGSNLLAPARVAGATVDRRTNAKLPLRTFASTRPPLVSRPAGLANSSSVRTRLPEAASGLSFVQSLARAQGATDTAADDVVTATGEFDAIRYGDVLRARGLVGLRGAGQSHDGLYYVKRVTHKIARGSYRQSFTLTREGHGALLPVVRP